MNTVDRRAHELIVTSPLGLVPRELERVYPAGHYDVPVTGYWDREECAFIADILARYFAAHPYRRVIAHLEGGALTVAEMAAEACGIELEVTCHGHPTTPGSLRALAAALEGERRVQTDMVRGTVSWQFATDISTKGLQVRGRSMQMAAHADECAHDERPQEDGCRSRPPPWSDQEVALNWLPEPGEGFPFSPAAASGFGSAGQEEIE